jgi:hypothetical protein
MARIKSFTRWDDCADGILGKRPTRHATAKDASGGPQYPLAYLRLEAGVQFVRIPQQDPVCESPNQVR